MASKQVRRRSQFLISSLGWPWMQSETRFKLTIYKLSQKTWFWANDSKHKYIVYRWKLFFTTINISGFLPRNKALFGSAPLSKFWQFVSKSVFDNSVIFVANGRYRYDRGIERNFKEPRNIINAHRRRQIKAILPRPFSRASTTSVGGSSVAEKLSSPPIGVLWSSS